MFRLGDYFPPALASWLFQRDFQHPKVGCFPIGQREKPIPNTIEVKMSFELRRNQAWRLATGQIMGVNVTEVGTLQRTHQVDQRALPRPKHCQTPVLAIFDKEKFCVLVQRGSEEVSANELR